MKKIDLNCLNCCLSNRRLSDGVQPLTVFASDSFSTLVLYKFIYLLTYLLNWLLQLDWIHISWKTTKREKPQNLQKQSTENKLLKVHNNADQQICILSSSIGGIWLHVTTKASANIKTKRTHIKTGR